MRYSKLLTFITTVVLATMLITVGTVSAMAIDTVTLPTEVYGEDVISVALPAISEEEGSPFDFMIDPQGLIYETDAARYGGGKVEEGATLLFRNQDGEYDFSKRSDRLTVRNQSNVAVIVTITASIGDLGEIEMLGSPDFEDSEDCSIYLAIVDDEGNERPVSEDGEVSVSIEMRKAPDNAYVYRIDEETGDYSYELTTSPEEVDFDSYSFGLVGYCNPNGNWQDISVHPRVTVTWRVEPVLSEEEEETDKDTEIKDEQASDEKDDEMVSDNLDDSQHTTEEYEEQSDEDGTKDSTKDFSIEEDMQKDTENSMSESEDASIKNDDKTSDDLSRGDSEETNLDENAGEIESGPQE